MAIHIASLDHLVLTVASIEDTVRFYEMLGMERIRFDGRTALRFGTQKINLHEAGREFTPHSRDPRPGSADLCFLIGGTLDDAEAHLRAHGIAIELGPVPRTGAAGSIRSLYLRDPDGNLIELSVSAE